MLSAAISRSPCKTWMLTNGWLSIVVAAQLGAQQTYQHAPRAIAATPAAVCNDCDYFLKDEPGCYMAKRAFSTPAGDELRCVKICEEPEGPQAPK